ncbi:hypothetical protein BT96DRAFT_923089 [Gymnopus androsaceus JB14]|uniref:Uncharacterized protein n=1 Tax=Gymnopus androsaceus JB14 TaxID=1447944 RepID=A0A6A4HCS9_9AGAR|nr:hypothetical protein BT96DRAFT_923089 [Gymnopus androsaceus JB14]
MKFSHIFSVLSILASAFVVVNATPIVQGLKVTANANSEEARDVLNEDWTTSGARLN